MKDKEIRFIVTVDSKKKEFLVFKETPKGDLIIYLKGKRSTIDLGQKDLSPDFSLIDKNIVTYDKITVHPNLQSEIGSITINRDHILDGESKDRERTYALEIKSGSRIIPLYGSAGRNLSSLNLDFDNMPPIKSDDVVLWPGQNINSKTDSVCYYLGICNKDLKFVLPEDYPRNTIFITTLNFQIFFNYWLFNQPVKLRGTSITHRGSVENRPDPIWGIELHEFLNLTNDLVINHANLYQNYPKLE